MPQLTDDSSSCLVPEAPVSSAPRADLPNRLQYLMPRRPCSYIWFPSQHSYIFLLGTNKLPCLSIDAFRYPSDISKPHGDYLSSILTR